MRELTAWSTVLLLACGAPAPDAPRPSSASGAGRLTNSGAGRLTNSGGERPAEDSALAEALDGFCGVAGELMEDRSRPLSERMRDLPPRVDANHPGRTDLVFGLLEDAPSDAEPEHAYDLFVEAAARRGVSFACEPLRRMLVMRFAGEEDYDPPPAPTLSEDLANLCEAFDDPALDAESPVTVAVSRVRNPTLMGILEVVASADGPDKMPILRRALADEGIADWQCPALEALFDPPPES